ncbi:hypothetical protein O6H91_18G034900 [Diphasiastrum complanatum]|uniref:Uncharacterized protein n=2 Tax=Diphasiastrum complanatum TaxID=34168 RepID=A0ACC2AZL8_DIPCM|nr:hypothetical protein O6H91_18G034900 [Diphasiastrum complanatum]KAJ7523018.1 hypothetical protein O6H91_18G034900 [Diphasiastrum complanatum]
MAAAQEAMSVTPDLQRIRCDVLHLLRDFEAELRLLGYYHHSYQNQKQQEHKEADGEVSKPDEQAPPAPESYGEKEWLAHLELKFIVRSLCLELRRALARSMGASVISTPSASFPSPSPSVVKEALIFTEKLLEKVEALEEQRLLTSDSDLHPLVLRVARRYDLSAAETDFFQLLFVRGASKSSAIRAALGDRQDDKDISMDLCGMSLLEVEEFLDDKRMHISEGIITSQDDYEEKTIRMTKEALSVLLLRPMKTEQRLKLSKTELLSVVDVNKAESHTDGGFTAVDDILQSMNVDLVLQVEQTATPGDFGRVEPVEARQLDAVDIIANSAPTSALQDEELRSQKRGVGLELGPYVSSLEYLDDGFQILALMLRITKARHKEDMKEANDEAPWYEVYRSSKASSIRELQAKLRYAENRLQERMRLTEEAMTSGTVQLPRLEALVRKLVLDDFEKGVVLMLTGVAISPVVKSIFESENGGHKRSGDAVQVQDILRAYFDSFKQQVLARTYFYKSSRLVARGLIKLRPSPYARGGGDLMDQQVELDRRILDWIVGLDTEMNELVEGSHLYKPKISMEQVVLPDEQKQLLLRTVDNFSKFREFRKSAGLEDVISYGASLVILLCGASGTGKTMTVNALAQHLGKRVLLVDFHSLHSITGASSRDDHSADVRGLFRDADMNDAIVFFDECEAIFAQRDRGSDRLLATLLTEMERHEGIIMLATNRPLDLDEAMHRRITCVSEFHLPDHTQRHNIWMVASQRLPVSKQIDWNRIALRYELTGGYIKNALVSALLLAISRDDVNPLVTEEDIIEGCRMQMRGNLQMKSFSHRVIPKIALDDLVLTARMREYMDTIVSFEKARAVLLGQWGFSQERLGTACLFWGPVGSGKSACAEAIGLELGRPLKVVNCAQLLSRDSNTKTGINVSTVFKDSRLMDAVLVLEDFQIFRSDDDPWDSSNVSAWSHVAIGLLLHELEQFPGICILIAKVVQGGSFHRLDPELVRRLKFVVEFKKPDQNVRSRMWQKMLPEKAPLAHDINFDELGRRFDFTSGIISSASVRAAAKAALRAGDKRVITHKDLVEAAEAESLHLRDEVNEIMLRAFV